MSTGQKLGNFFEETKPRTKFEADVRGAVTVTAIGGVAIGAILGFGGVFKQGLEAGIDNYPRVENVSGLVVKDGATGQSNPGPSTGENYVGTVELKDGQDSAVVPGEVHAWYGGGEQYYCMTADDVKKALGEEAFETAFSTNPKTPFCLTGDEARLEVQK